MLGHELRNPLAPIRNAVAILRAGTGDAGSEERAASVIERQVDHLTRLVDDLLDVSRITSGKIALRKEPIDLPAPVLAAVEAARPAFERKKQAFEFRHDGSPLPVTGDETRLTQIVLNLLNNASKYTPAGGHISLLLERAERQAVIRVKDDGIGIAPDLLPRMFDLFVQGERGLDRSEGGLGLGLTLVRRLVAPARRHRAPPPARARAAAASSRSACPSTRPPRRPAPEQAPAATTPPRYRVLVVDDNEDSAETMATLVGMWGHDVRTAHDAASALQAAAEHRPDVVLLDIGLPHVSGYEVAAQLRALPGLEARGPDRDDGLRPGGGPAPHARGRLHPPPHEAGAAGDAEGDPVVAGLSGGRLPLDQRGVERHPAAAPPLAPQDGRGAQDQRDQAQEPAPRARTRPPSSPEARPARRAAPRPGLTKPLVGKP